MDYLALKTEIQTDPKALGLLASYNAGNCQAVADALNATTGAGASTAAVAILTGDQFRTAILPAAMVLPTLTSQIQAKYQPLLTIANAAQAVDLGNATIQLALSSCVTDGLLTQAQHDAVGRLPCGRAVAASLVPMGFGVQINDVLLAMAPALSAWSVTITGVVTSGQMVTVTANAVGPGSETIPLTTFGVNMTPDQIRVWAHQQVVNLQARDAAKALSQPLVNSQLT